MPRAPVFNDNHIKPAIAKAMRARKAKGLKDRPWMLFIPNTPNLYLRISKSGEPVSWIMRYSQPNGSGVAEKSLGRYSAVTLEMAKNRVEHSQKIMLRNNKDPFKEDLDEGTTTITFGEAVDRLISKDYPEQTKQRAELKHLLKKHGNELLTVPVNKLQPEHIRDAYASLWEDKPKQLRRALPKVWEVLNFAKTIVPALRFRENPATWRTMKHYFRKRPKSDLTPLNFAAMPFEQIPQFIRDLRQRQDRSVAAMALEFCILTATRTNETLGMRWDEVPLLWTLPPDKTWNISAGRMKARRVHQVPLSDRAVEILEWRQKYAFDSPYVFFGYQKDKALDDKSMRLVLHKMRLDYTIHGFRSSFRDWGGDKMDFPRETLEQCLAHQVGDATETAYRRRTALEKRRVVMQAWAKYCSSLCG